MATLRATVVLERISKKPEEASRNVWHFATSAGITAADMTKVGDFLSNWYSGNGSIFSGVINRAANAHRIEFAEVSRGGPGPADDSVSTLLATRDFTLAEAAPTGPAMPSEVALAFSFRGDVVGVAEEASGGLVRPKSRRRGRVFLGPLHASLVAATATTNEPRLNIPVGAELVDSYLAGIAVLTAAPTSVNHVVYSRADGVTRPVVHCHVDNAWDTIRSRGEKATQRAERVVVQTALAA